MCIPALDRNHTPPIRQSFSSKLVRTLRGGLAKLLPRRDNSLDDLSNSAEDQKNNRSGSNGHLEYPELELLPYHGGYKELEALEKTIDHIKRPSVDAEVQLTGISATSSRTPLSLRFAQEVHNHQHDERNGPPDTIDFPKTTSSQHPNTPVGKHVVSKTISATSQLFCPSLLHVSYEDCLPKHMLDENDSIKSDTMVAIKRSKSALEHSISRLPHKYSTWNGRARSMSIKRLRAYGSKLEKMLAVERERKQQNENVLTKKIQQSYQNC
jgi:hypothetical protein